jgi:hypothetical protein
MSLIAIALSVWLAAAQVATDASANDRLAAVKALYAATEYEAALIVLSKVDVGSVGDQYRALCLLALGRLDEVDRLLESLIVRDPSFQMSVAEVTPRLIALFQETRRRLLPGILDDSFTAAKTSFEHGRFAEASAQFKALLTLLAGEDARLGEGAPGQNATVTRDMRRVAEGFLNLAEKAVADGSKANAESAASTMAIAAASAAARSAAEDEAVIASVVQQYADAYAALDAEAVTRVFQGENPRPLQYLFNALKSQTIETRDMKIAVDPGGWSATVTLNWVVHAVPKAGSPKKTQMLATFRMLKVVTGEWFIVTRR